MPKLMVTKSTGEKVEAEINAAFGINDFGRKYVIYSFGETDPNGLAKLNVSQILEDGGKYTFANIESDDEWNRIKNIMRDMITGTNTIDTVIKLDNLETNITGNKNIAVPNDGPTKISNSYNTSLTKLAPTPEVQTSTESAPAIDITVNNDTPTDTLFEQAPAELNPKTPLDSMVEPFNIETPAPTTPVVEQPAAPAAPVVEAQPTPVVDVQPIPTVQPVATEPIAAANTLSDAEFIKQFEELVNKTGIRQQTIKEQMRRRIEDLLMQAKNMDYIEDKVNEMADVVKATNEMVKASNNLNQVAPVQATPTQTANVAPITPITPAPQTTTNQTAGGTTPVQAAPGGPTLTYQQTA